MKKIAALLILILLAAGLAAAQSGPPGWPFEIGLYGGVSYGANTWTSLYGTTWGKYNLTQVEETTVIEILHKLGFAGGVSAAYYFTPTLGVQLLAGGMHESNPSTAYFQFAWLWKSDVDNLKSRNFEGTGSLTTLPFSLNVAARLGQDSVKGILSAGVSLFRNTFQAKSTFGYGVDLIKTVFVDPNYVVTQYVDALPVEIEIPSTTWTKIGANLGAGLDIETSPTTSLRVDVRYYYCPSQTLNWSYVQKTYDGMFYNDINDYAFGQADLDVFAARGRAFAVKLNPSFFQLSLGFIVRLGVTQ
jgi:opacity protein-like surface antigen